MESQAGVCRLRWKATIFIVLTTFIVHVAECNYAALFDYERNKYLDDHQSFVVEDYNREVILDHPIHFYGEEYSKLRVGKDGTVSFGSDVVTYKREPLWRRGFTELTSTSDKPFIGAFHYDGYASNSPQTYQGRLYISQYHKQNPEDRTLETQKHRSFLEFLSKYLSHSTVTIDTFQPDLYVMVTWENVTDYDTKSNRNFSCNADVSNPCPSATFQLVIAANSENTFLIFNYAKMDIPFNRAHLMGMNGGNGRGWTEVVKCVGACFKSKHRKQIPSLLPTLQGSSSYQDASLNPDGRDSGEIRGRFLFLVTNDVIVRGGCLPHDTKAGYMDTVEVYPDHVAMLGGEIIKVSGQCQDPYTPIYCRFDKEAITEGKISAGMVGWCPVPRLTSGGQVRLEVSADRNVWQVYTQIITMPPDLVNHLSDNTAMQPWFQVNPSELSISWHRSSLTEDDRATVDIVVVQYRETGDQVVWEDLIALAEHHQNTGSFQFDPRSDERRYTCQDHCDGIELGVVEIRLTKDYLESATKNQYIAIGPLPLAWYVNRKNTELRGGNWFKEQCERWADWDNSHKQWLTDLPPCPCTLQQALADWGRWQADIGCNLYGRIPCSSNPGAVHCVRSVQPTSSAADSHCCYDRDSNLMYAGDSYHGSTSSRAHAFGAAPYHRAGTVPTMSHWLRDLIPYHYCCKWTDEAYCALYTQNRPTKDCRYYDPPGSAIMFGDPHVITFDDEHYHFGGDGDFWLVDSPGLSVQARFLERQDNAVRRVHNILLPTYISSVAIKGEGNSNIVTFAKAPPGGINRRRLSVMINRRHYFFDEKQYMWQEFRGLTVVNNEVYAKTDDDRHHSNFSVLLANGAGVQVAERSGLLNVVVVLPPLKKNEDNTVLEIASKGLLGAWDEKKSNEFMKPDGNYVPASESNTVKYRDFALEWAVKDDGSSLFRFNQPTSAKLPHLDSLSSYLDPDLSPTDAEVSAECGTSSRDYDDACAYDFYVTSNRTVARNTRVTKDAFDSLRRSQKKIWSCGWLDIPFAIKDHTNYSAGNTLRVTDCREGLGSTGSVSGGPVEYMCIQNETERQPFWEPYKINHNLCTEDADSASVAMIAGIVAAAVAFIIVIVIVVIVIYKRKSARKESVSKPRTPARDDAAMDPGTDETLLKHKRGEREAHPTSERQELSV